MAPETSPPRTRMAFVGCGRMASHHLRRILQQRQSTEIVAVCEPSPDAYENFCEICAEESVEPPPNEPLLADLLSRHGESLDAVFIITPHVLHFSQARSCLEAGLDVLLEKPMVMTAQEAEALIEVQERSGRLLVVAFNGSLSPQIRTAANLLRSGELGRILSISAVVWQGWKAGTTGTWRQVPEAAGGGFLFDTGAHMLNTVADLAGEEFVEVAAWLDNRGTPVDILGTVMGRLHSGGLVTMNGCGETIPGADSDVRVFCSEGIIQTCVWGRRLLVQRSGEKELSPVEVPETLGTWEQFLQVRNGAISNPSPPQTGLRMARLWDAIRLSASQKGKPVSLQG